jgi:16S rRNA (adenine1518-N6/adenine1519-N6)-dimethyltransferase
MAPSTKRRALGQHFLRSGATARAIVDLLAPGANDLVVEIGPGQGALTEELARTPARLVALEIDAALVPRLRQRFPRAEIIEADARGWDYGALAAPPGGRVLVAGNLPYSISKPLLMALVAARGSIAEMALMLQREVAERVAAPPGGKVYGSLSVLTQLYCDVRLALHVPPEAFKPPPKVDSAVVHLRVLERSRIPLADEARFHVVVRAAFSQRRKMIANALGPALGLGVDAAREALTAAGIDPSRRAETLTIQEFGTLTSQLS